MTTARIVEVGPRDGFQSIAAFIPTADKISILHGLYDAGVRRIEATSFVSERAVPQFADAVGILEACRGLPGLDVQALVPNYRHAMRALEAGAEHLSFVVSASERHNLSNVKQTPHQSVDAFAEIVASASPGTRYRVNVATAFDCPFEGTMAVSIVIDLIDRLLAVKPDVEIALCDTTGRAVPAQVKSLFEIAAEQFSPSGWAFHAHDTFGLGAANVLAAWYAGVRTFDASVAGLGGCPFAPGATGNVATEDVIWMLSGMGADTGIDLQKILPVAHAVSELPGAQVGGRVRDAVRARAALSEAAAG